MSLQLRRGTNAERKRIVFAVGEIVYATDTKQIFVGDGATTGGNEITLPRETLDAFEEIASGLNATIDNRVVFIVDQDYVNDKARKSVSAGENLLYDSATGVFSSLVDSSFIAAIVNEDYVNAFVTHDSAAVLGQITSTVNTSYVQGKIDQSFIDQFDTHDSVAIQNMINTTIAATDTHDSAAVLGQINSTVNQSFINTFDTHDEVAVDAQITSTVNQSFINGFDTHDEVAVQNQITSTVNQSFINTFDTHDSAAVLGQITSTVNQSFINGFDTHDEVAVQAQIDSAVTQSFINTFDTHDSAAVDAQIDAKLGTNVTVGGNLSVTGYIDGPEVFTIDPAAVGDATGKVVILGNLQVDGVQTTVNSTTVSIADKNIVLADSATSSAEANDAGITVNGASATIKYKSTGDKWEFNKDVSVSGTVDGRNIANDGSKLDGIETNATADQTATEIKSLYESNADTNNFDNAAVTKLSNIEDSATADQTGSEIKALYEAEADTNAFDNAAVTKLAGIEANATADQTGSEIKALYEAESNTNAFTDSEQTKLAGIEANATQDQTGSEIKALYEAESDTNAYTDSEKTKLAGIEALATADMTGAEIKTAYEAESDTNAYDDVAVTKLAGIEANATADQTASEIKTAYESNADTNNYDDAAVTKLAGIEALADVTDATNVEPLVDAHINVNAASSSQVLSWTGTDYDWVDQSGGGGSQTAAEIKTAYESNADTNAYDDAAVTKLAGIEALADVTDATNVAAAGAVMDADIGVNVQAYSSVLAATTASYTTAEETKLSGIESNATADQTAAEIKTAYENNSDTNAYDDAAVTKLSGIEALADVTDATNVAAAGAVMDADVGVNVQAYSSVLAATTASYTTAEETKLSGIEANATADQTGAEIKTAYEAESNTNAYTDAEKTKLTGIESSAKDDQTGAEIKALYEAESNTNAYTDAEKTKLAGIETNATADQTAAEIKTAYESNADTNNYDDAAVTKLSNIEANATADMTGAEIKTAYEAEASAFTDAQFTKLSGIEAGATADQTASEILTAIKTVDGSGTGLDADTVDGIEAAALTQSGDNVALTGDVTGSTTVAVDGSISVATTISANSVALGVDTTGNYVATVSGTANEIEVSGSGSENAAVTVGLPSNVTINSNLTVGGYIAGPEVFTIDPAAVGDATGKVVILGNLQVDGVQTTINSTEVSISDKNIVLADSATSAAEANGAGITVNGASATLQYVSTGDKWEFNKDVSVSGDLAVSGTINDLDIGHGGGNVATNTAVGSAALEDNTSGERNTAIGQTAMANATTGSYNTAIGQVAMGTGVVTGSNNTGIGADILKVVTSGSNNTAIGRSSMGQNTTGGNNVAVGKSALSKNTTGSNNVVVGTSALILSSSGAVSNNVAIGANALDGLNPGQNSNIAIGYRAGRDLDSGTKNIIIGVDAEASATNVSNEITLGDAAKSFRIPGSEFYINGGSEGTTGSRVGINTSTPTEQLDVNGNAVISGNISVSGTVDGRDVATDGTKLDGIEASATADQTGSQIKALYEGESNAFTDALFTKLSGIETGATADQTASEILTAIKTVDGTTSGLDADTVDGIEGASLLRSDVADTKTSGDLNFADNVKATFGAGSDLQIYHDGSNSYIQDAGTGDLLVDGASVYIRTMAGNKYFGGSANIATLYHTDNPKLATTSTGVDVTGTITADGLNLGDGDFIRLGDATNGDFQIYHSGSDNHGYITKQQGAGHLFIENAVDDQDVIIRSDNGSGGVTTYFRADGSTGKTLLYKNGNEKLATTSTGIDVTGTITADGVEVTGDITFSDSDNIVMPDNSKIKMGTGADLEIYHDGSHSYIDDVGTGDLRLRGNGSVKIMQYNNSEQMAAFKVNGAVELYHDNVKKFETTSAGVSIPGKVEIEEDGAVNDRLLYLNSAGGLSGGQSGPFYGLYADIKSNNDATEAYGAYIKAQGGGGDNTYGIWAQATQANSTKDAIGVLGKTIVASGSTNHGSERALGTGPAAGLYALAETTGTGTASQTTALHASNASTHGSLAYGVYIETISGPTTVVPLKIDHDGSEIFKVDSDGTVTADGLTVDTNTLHVDATNNRVGIGTTSPATTLDVSGTVTATGFTVGGDITFSDSDDLILPDNSKIKLGDASDLQIYHDGSNSRIADFGTGELRLQGTNLRLWSATGENYLTALENGAVSLYYDNSAKIATTNTGVDVTGSITATSFSGDGSSLTGISAGATGGSTDQVFYENDQAVTTNYTISTNKNAMTAGPITVNSGVTVTIPTGSEWSIV